MIREWIDALELKGCHPKRKGKEWQALCPAHDDKNPSFTVSEGDGQDTCSLLCRLPV